MESKISGKGRPELPVVYFWKERGFAYRKSLNCSENSVVGILTPLMCLNGRWNVLHTEV